MTGPGKPRIDAERHYPLGPWVVTVRQGEGGAQLVFRTLPFADGGPPAPVMANLFLEPGAAAEWAAIGRDIERVTA